MDDGQTYDYRQKRQLIYRRFTFKNNELHSKYDPFLSHQYIPLIWVLDHLILRLNLRQMLGSNVL